MNTPQRVASPTVNLLSLSREMFTFATTLSTMPTNSRNKFVNSIRLVSRSDPSILLGYALQLWIGSELNEILEAKGQKNSSPRRLQSYTAGTRV